MTLVDSRCPLGPAAARRVLAFAVLSLFVALPLAAQFTGTWSGTFQMVDNGCTPPLHTSGPITMSINQSGNNAVGIATMEVTQGGCQAHDYGLASLPLSGSVSGNSLSGTVIVNAHQIPEPGTLDVTLSGGTMSMTSTQGTTVITATLTHTSSAEPDSTGTGSYSGTYSLIEPHPECKNLTTLTDSGPLSGPLTRSGGGIAGVLTAIGSKDLQMDSSGNCTVVSASSSVTMQVFGQISGGAVTGYLVLPTDVEILTATLSGSTLTGTGTSLTVPTGLSSGNVVTFSISTSSGTLPPSIVTFGANPNTISPGASSMLSWVTANATSVSLDQGIGSQSASGSRTVTPSATTTYTLTASNSAGSATATTTVTVAPAAPPPNVAVAAMPSWMLWSPGSPLPADRYTLVNLGGTDTTITLTQTGSFFTQTPASFTLGAYSSAVVFLSATSQAAGSYQGFSNVSGNGVVAGLSIPVGLLVSGPPAAPVTVTPGQLRIDLTAPAGQAPTGTASFTNPGATAIQGVVVSDVPWIVVASPYLTIGAGETKQVPFTIDRSRRPDGTLPAGGVVGSLTFRYVNALSTAPTGKVGGLGTTPVLTNVSVSIVDMVTLSTTSAGIPPLGTGEVAMFLGGMSSKNGAISDLVLSNRTGSAIGDLRMFFAPLGPGGGQSGSVPQLSGQTNIAFPAVVKNVFGGASQTGTIAVRSTQLASNAVSVVGTQITSNLGASYVTAMPLWRSNRGFLPGDQIFLPGVQKTATQTTTLYLQELTGNSSTLTVDFLDANGSAIGASLPETLPGFGSLELTDAVPVNAVTARVTNTSSGSAVINAFAMVIDSVTSDRFTIVQVAQPADPIFCPSFGATTAAGRDMVLNLANASSGPITVSVCTLTGELHHRAATHAAGGSLAASPTAVTIPGLGCKQVHVSDVGIVKVSGSTAVRVTGTYSVNSLGGSYGSGVAALPASGALPPNSIKRFAGIEDASADNVAAARPLTYRNNLMLAEIAGQPATVRLTLRYVFSSGTLVSSGAVQSRDYALPAGGVLVINDLAQSIIGPGRQYLGDLHDAILDVGILETSAGSVLPFLQVVDQHTGEVTIRND